MSTDTLKCYVIYEFWRVFSPTDQGALLHSIFFLTEHTDIVWPVLTNSYGTQKNKVHYKIQNL